MFDIKFLNYLFKLGGVILKSLYLEIQENNNSNLSNDIRNPKSHFEILLTTLCDAKNSNEKAILFFIEKYQFLIKKYAFKYKLKNYDTDDLIQIGNIAVIVAINKFDPIKGGEYIDAYIINSIKNSFKNLARNQIKYKDESSLNIAVDEDTEIEDLISDSFDLEDYVINSMMIDSLKTALSPDEFELIRIAYLTENCTLYRYCIEHNWNYPKKRRELIALLPKIRKLIEN